MSVSRLSGASLLAAFLALWISTATLCHAFSIERRTVTTSTLTSIRPSQTIVLWNSESSDQDEDEKEKMSLEDKMKSWEASEEEIKAASLGGVVPQSRGDKERTGAFDVGLYIAFPIMVITGLIFALFPFIMGSIDVDSVGPPPTV
ncbi:MAG: hypothetical protein SGILL_002880 [Bacillariaceae sp.]